ncbi:RHS repeat-associated core domain-containing protein [Cohnella cellulosilytica]|uniref:RHS repeat-associated core domain-containing protein n=2 Tax=Cohnella cellulosilytica TaxID=986710 RepID=A0ABW2F409_9BACL
MAMLILSLLITVNGLTTYAPDQTSANSASSSSVSIQDILSRFSTTEAFVQQQLNSGLELEEIYLIFFHAKINQMNYEEAYEMLYPEEINLSSEVESETINEVTELAEKLQGYTVVEEETEENSENSSELNSLEGRSNAQRIQTQQEPILEQPPVFDSTRISQAPYSVGTQDEQVSTLSGALSIQQADFTLPGRNGLSFALTRQYSTSDAQLYDMGYSTSSYQYQVPIYSVTYNRYRIPYTLKYQIVYREVLEAIQEDRNNDGNPDSSLYYPTLKYTDNVYGTYNTKAEAQSALSQGIKYGGGRETRTATDTRTSPSESSLPSSISYNQNGYTGTLYKSGSVSVSGSYTPAASKTESTTCINEIPGKYNSSGNWVATGSETNPCQSSKPYNSGGYSGTLNRTSTTTLKACASPGTANWVCTKKFQANYSGTVTKPVSDTRSYTQNYSGTVGRDVPASNKRYGSWTFDGSISWRYVYAISSSPAPQIKDIEILGQGQTYRARSGQTDSLTAANDLKASINNQAGALIAQSDSAYEFIASPAGATVETEYMTATGYTYHNSGKTPLKQLMYPIGKGWKWNLPYMELNEGKRYISLPSGGYYEVTGSGSSMQLKGYEWNNLSIATNASVVVNAETSAYVLSFKDGSRNYYFTNDGRLIQISDAYNNKILLAYQQNAAYNRKLLSQIEDAIGNKINITYTKTEVVLTQGNQTVTYHKNTENGTELLSSVTDAENRVTTYSYRIAQAASNLFEYDSARAMSNPYALLTKTQHPTGAITEYSYEGSPVKRFIGSSSSNQAYRLSARKDQIVYSNGTLEDYNYQSFDYHNQDVGSSYGQDLNFTTSITDGLTLKNYAYKKDYIDSNTPTQYYLMQETENAENKEFKTEYTYAKQVAGRNFAASVPTTIKKSNNINSDVLTENSSYDDFGNVLTFTNANGVTTTYTYDSVKQLLATELQPVSASAALHTTYSRNAQGSITQITVRKNNAAGEILQQVDYGNYDSFGNARTISYANGSQSSVVTRSFSSAYQSAFLTSQSIAVKDVDQTPATIIVQQEYNLGTGQVIADVDGLGNRTEYTYDKLGRITRIKYADQKQVNVSYDDLLNTSTVTDEDGRTSKTTWNMLGQKIEEGTLASQTYIKRAKYSYDPHNRLIWIEDAMGNRTQTQFDNWSRPVSVTFANGVINQTQYDDVNRKVVEIDGENNETITIHDKFGRVIKVEDKQSNGSIVTRGSTVYDPINGNVVEQADAKGQKTTYNYNVLGMLQTVTNAKGESTSYTYDRLGNLVQLTNPDQTTKLKQYDQLGRTILTQDESGQIEKLYYDANGNLVQRADRNLNTTTYAYNNRNRVASIVNTEETISFTYDGSGHRTSMIDNTGMTHYEYTSDTGTLKKVTYPDGLNLQLQYDLNGNRTQMTDPFGNSTYYTFNTVNQLQAIGDTQGTSNAIYSYLGNGLIKDKSAENGIKSNFSYSGFDLTGLNHAQGSLVLKDYAYSYDTNRNITAIAADGATSSYTYDSLNRILSESDSSTSYSYDPRGNRLTMESDASPGLRDHNYQYNKRNMLTKVMSDELDVQYRYNGDGLLVERIEGNTTSRYYYDGDQMIAEANVVEGTPELKASYIRGNQLEAIKYADGQKAYVTYNGHGDVVELRDAQGELLNRYEYDTWGNILSKEEEVYNPFRYSGEYWDDSTGLQYLRARWYDPTIGRFINEDSYQGELNNPLTLNLYIYVANNPLIYRDPSGHEMAGDGKYGSFVYDQLKYLGDVWRASAGDSILQAQIHDTADYLRFLAGSGTPYAIISLDTFLPVDTGTDPWGDTYLGNGDDRQFGVNDLNVKTLQYAAVNLRYNSFVGFNYVTVTERINSKGEVIASKRDSNAGMSMASNLDRDGKSNFTIFTATTSARNELSLGSPSLDYSVLITISNMNQIKVSGTVDKFPSYEGYISINGGNFNSLYQFSAIPAPGNPFYNLAFSRGSFSSRFSYR